MKYWFYVTPLRGLPYPWPQRYPTLMRADTAARGVILKGHAKVIIVFRDKVAVNLYVRRPATYVHDEAL